VALPANAAATNQETAVSSVSCSSAGNCTAVGSYLDSSGNTEGLLLTETAGAWSVGVEAALPPNAVTTGQSAGLSSVSCSSAGNCTAVGRYEVGPDRNEALFLTETAGSWSAGVEASLPANAASDAEPSLGSVSCASAGNCVAVGSYYDGPGDTRGLLLTQTAGSWASGVEATLPPNAATTTDLAQLLSVSCPLAGNCTAVGQYYDSSQDSQGLLLTETAGTWAPGVEAILPANTAQSSTGAFLQSVSCPSPGDCSAVGDYNAGSTPVGTEGLLLTETAGGWSTGTEAALPADATTPNPQVELHSVSCPSPGNCSAVGRYYNSSTAQGLLLNETAGSWATGIEALPANHAAGTTSPLGLWSVSCASAGDCSAVGGHYDGGDTYGDFLGILLTEETGSWATGTVASLPANARNPNPYSALYSVSCPSAGSCAAGGLYATSKNEEGLVTGDSPPVVRLEISKNGTGSGTVSSVPAGIDCGPTCSATFDAGPLTLTFTPSPGSRFTGWSGGECSGTSICNIDVVSDQAVTATYSLLPKCVVPQLKGKPLKAAKHAIRTHNCTVGSISRATSPTINKGRVISQEPNPGKRLPHGAKVNLVISNGRA
jgi:hypothetical protein